MERMKLTVKTVNPVREVGEHNAPLLEFNAENNGATYQYQSFRKSIFEFIKTGAVIDVDVELSEREYNSQHYTDRKVIQLYQNGQPAGGQKQQFGGGYRGKTPEEIAAERASIEAQTAFNGIIHLVATGTIMGIDHPLAKKALKYAEMKLDAVINPVKAEPQPPPIIVKPVEKPPVAPTAEQAGQAVGTPVINLDWLNEQLNSPKLKKSWPATQMMTWLRNHNAGASTIPLGAAKLNKEDAAAFCKEITDRMAMA